MSHASQDRVIERRPRQTIHRHRGPLFNHAALNSPGSLCTCCPPRPHKMHLALHTLQLSPEWQPPVRPGRSRQLPRKPVLPKGLEAISRRALAAARADPIQRGKALQSIPKETPPSSSGPRPRPYQASKATGEHRQLDSPHIYHHLRPHGHASDKPRADTTAWACAACCSAGKIATAG